MADIDTVNFLGKGRVDFTIGSALDIFGGTLSYAAVIKKMETLR
jgi:phosphoribosylformimino-5-aminoimidazole carboxamide ribotide isomerase